MRGSVPGSSPTLKNLSVKNYGGPTQMVVDVTGYYHPQMHATLDPSGGIFNGSPRVLFSTVLGVG